MADPMNEDLLQAAGGGSGLHSPRSPIITILDTSRPVISTGRPRRSTHDSNVSFADDINEQSTSNGQFLSVTPPSSTPRRKLTWGSLTTRKSSSSHLSGDSREGRKFSRKISRASLLVRSSFRKTSVRFRLGRSGSNYSTSETADEAMPRRFLRQDSILVKVKPGQYFSSCAEIIVESPAKTDPNLGTLGELRHHLNTSPNDQIKKFLRNNHWSSGNRIRSELWKELCRDPETGARMLLYRDTVSKLTKHGDSNLRPALISAPNVVLCDHQLTSTGKQALLRILTTIEHLRPDFTNIPIIYPLGAVMLHYMSEEDTFCCLMRLLKNQIFLLQTDIAATASRRTLLMLLKKHRANIYTQLKRIMPSEDDQQMIALLENWKGWIFRDLPFFHIVRIVDCFLYEGQKVLFRVAIAILDCWIKSPSRSRARSTEPGSSAQKATIVANEISQFCKSIPIQPDKLLKYVGLSSYVTIDGSMNTRMFRKQFSVDNERLVKLMQKLDLNVDSQTAFGIRNLKTATIRRLQEKHELSSRKRDGSFNRAASEQNVESMMAAHRFTDVQLDSRLMDNKQNCLLISWLPARMQLLTPRRLFSLHEEGTSFTRLWQKIDQYEPTIIIIKTSRDEVFGAYCSSDWAARHSKERQKSRYFGTGETFLFRLSPELNEQFVWIGRTKAKVEHTEELFQTAENDCLIIGGGALSIRGDLVHGHSDSSETFGTPPLSEGKDLEIAELEVHGFIVDEEE